MSAIRQWILAALAIFGAFIAAGICGSIATDLLGLWNRPGAGFCAASAVVVSTYVAVPHHRSLLACCAFGLGAAVAWVLLEPSWYPENYGAQGYEPTHLPIIATYVSGLLGLAAAGIHRLRSGPNNSSKPTPLRGAA